MKPLKPKYVVGFEGTHLLFGVRQYKADKNETITHEATNPPFNTVYGGWLFSSASIAAAFAESLNVKINRTKNTFHKIKNEAQHLH